MTLPEAGRQPRYKRILLKLSGEALMGSENFGIDPKAKYFRRERAFVVVSS